MTRTYHHHIGSIGAGVLYARPLTEVPSIVDSALSVATASRTSTENVAITDATNYTNTGPITTVATDSFDRGTQATLGTADVGGAWTALAASWAITNNQARLNTTGIGQAVAMLPATTALAAGQVMVDIQLSAGNAYAGLILRGTDLNSYCSVELQKSPSVDLFGMSKSINGVGTYWVTTTPMGLLGGSGYTLAVILTTTGITAYVDGVLTGSYSFTPTDISQLTGSRIGLRSWDAPSSNEDGGSRWDDFSATTTTTLTPRIPAAPMAPSATAVGSTATLSWTKAGNGSALLSSYTVTATTDGQQSIPNTYGAYTRGYGALQFYGGYGTGYLPSAGGTTVQTYPGISASATSYSMSDLTPGMAWSFTVTAINSVGSRVSATSNAVNM